MEEKINVEEILKDKSQGTKLYDLLYNIDVELDTISTTDTETVVWCTNETDNNTTCHRGYSEFGTVRGCSDGLQILLPSKSMRDWSKFAWKKGDVLVCTDGKAEVIFESFDDDNYTSFVGKHYLESYGKDGDLLDYEQEHFGDTANYTKESDETVQCYINTIEKRLGGKLNRETLEIEKTQSEFKDGDIVCYTSLDGDKCIGIVKETENDAIVFHVKYNLGMHNMEFNVSILKGNFEFYKSNDLDDEIALNEALHFRYKSWDAEKKQIFKLKPKIEFKPFDKVLVRDDETSEWKANFYSQMGAFGGYECISGVWGDCIPYEGNEHLLGTTKDVEG